MMSIAKRLMQFVSGLFFKVYFSIFGKPTIPSYLKQALPKYENDGFGKLFQIIRIWDAPYEVLSKYIPKKGVVIDLGCGDGLLANAIAISAPKTKVWGLDINKDRIAQAEKGVPNARFSVADIVTKRIPKANRIFLVHVLHHLPSTKAQEALIDKCISKLEKRGELIIVEIDNSPFLKYCLTWVVDAFVIPILFEGKFFDFTFRYRSKRQWKKLLKAKGLKVKHFSASKEKPFSHIVFVVGR